MWLAIMVAHSITPRMLGRRPAPAPIGRFAGQARFPALELTPSIGYGPAPERSTGVATTRRDRAASEVLGKHRIGVSTIQFDHQWEDIDVEA
jgi:hypothetical protein